MTATLMINGRKQFFNANGDPLAGGFLYYYVPATTTFKTTWQDSGQTLPNTNPIILDSAGTALVYGSGIYREYVTDSHGNLTQDALTSWQVPVSDVATIAALRLQSGTPTTSVYVLGYYSPADGGEGTFIYVPSDTTTADNGGTVIVDASGNRWYRDTEAGGIQAAWFGVLFDGATDNLTRLQAAVTYASTSGKELLLSPGTAIVSGTISLAGGTGSLTMRGSGRYSTTIKTSSATANIFTLAVAQYEVTDLTISCSTTRTAGVHFSTTSNAGTLLRLSIANFSTGILAGDNQGLMRDIIFTSPTNGGTGILVSGFSYPVGLVLDNILMYGAGGVTPKCGINVVNCQCLQMVNCNIVQQGADLLINPGTGQGVFSLWANNCFFDTATYGVSISPTGTGNVVRCRFDCCWASSHTQTGVLVQNAGSGSVSGIHFVDLHALLNTGAGINVAATGGGTLPVDVSIIGGEFCANGAGGILFGAAISQFSVIGATAGGGAGLVGNTGYGIFVAAGASDHYIIQNNRVLGNTIGGVSDGGAGVNKAVGNNIL